MTFEELARKRYSVRHYAERPVERLKIEACVEAARLAPSACNAQPWRFVVADDPSLAARIAPLTTTPGVPINSFVQQAPVIVALVTERPNLSSRFGAAIQKTPFHLIDVGIAAEHFCLQAAELGLGTCMLGWFDKKKIKRILGIPARKELPLLITLGYPKNEEIPKKARRDLDEILDYRRYGG
jgi:nitroreductase